MMRNIVTGLIALVVAGLLVWCFYFRHHDGRETDLQGSADPCETPCPSPEPSPSPLRIIQGNEKNNQALTVNGPPAGGVLILQQQQINYNGCCPGGANSPREPRDRNIQKVDLGPWDQAERMSGKTIPGKRE